MATALMDRTTFETVLRGLARGEYHLLLGGGASLGATGGDGRPIPDGPGLASELASDFRLPSTAAGIGLARTYEVAKDSAGAAKIENMDQYLRRRFSGCKPSWQPAICKVRWRRIWTVNIDDVIENAYACAPDSLQRPVPISWTQPYREPDRTLDEVPIIHLHGYAPRLVVEKDEQLVFSILEYVQAGAPRYAWARVFGDLFLSQPFIVVGASLVNEYDLAEVLRRGNMSHQAVGLPSLIVLPKLETWQTLEFKRWGLFPVQADAQTFLSEVVSALPSVDTYLATLVPSGLGRTLTPQVKLFLSQFQWLHVDTSAKSRDGQDLYRGDEPTWADILANRDARFEVVDRVLAAVASGSDVTSRSQHAVHCIWGSPGCGKSTALLRLGRELISRGYEVFLFRGEERVNVPAAVYALAQSPRVALLFDGLADASEDIASLIERARALGLPALVVGTERETRLNKVRIDIAPEYLKADKGYGMNRLTRKDAVALVKVLSRARRLGVLTRRSYAEQTQHFLRGSGGQLLPAMTELEGALGFQERVLREYAAIPSALLSRTYTACCVSYLLGYPTPLGILCAATGLDAVVLRDLLRPGGALFGVLRLDGRGCRPRHRVIARLVLAKAVDEEQRFELFTAIATALAPYLTVEAIRQRTVYYRVARELLDAEWLSAWLGHSRACRLYDAICQHYDWNARFWEQRALAELEKENYPVAWSYAEQAVLRHEDPLTLNTLGTVKMRMATEYYKVGSADAADILWKGIKNLERSTDMAKDRFEHPFITFFSYVLKYSAQTFADQPIEPRLSREWQNWYRRATVAPAFRFTEDSDRLGEFHRKWLMQAAADGN